MVVVIDISEEVNNGESSEIFRRRIGHNFQGGVGWYGISGIVLSTLLYLSWYRVSAGQNDDSLSG